METPKPSTPFDGLTETPTINPKKFRIWFGFLTVIIGVAFWVVSFWPGFSNVVSELVSFRSEVASILSSYAFTVAGFLATIATFLYTLGERPFFKLYQRRGNFSDLVFLHVATLATLATILVLSIGLLAYPSLLRPALALTVLSILQLIGLTLASYSLTRRSLPLSED